MGCRAVIFDMDGTILDTTEDLAAAVDYAMEECGHRHDFTAQDARTLFGSGIHTALQRAFSMESGRTDPEYLRRIGTPELAVVPGVDEEEIGRVEEAFRPYYLEHSMDRTGPYEGIPELLRELRSRGFLTAVVSNKPDPAVRKLAEECFGGLFDAAIGEHASIRRKPAPDMTLAALEQLGVPAREAVYIGDTEIDVQTAENAGIPCVCVSWGFRSREFLESLHPFAVIDEARELLPLLSREMYDVTVIGPAVIDILAASVGSDLFSGGGRYLDRIRMSFGGDALNESAVLSRLGKKVQLISKVGDDEAGRRILDYLRENGIDADFVCVEPGLDTAINIALIDKDGSRRFLMGAESSLRRLGLADVEKQLDRGEAAGIVCFASMFISPLFTVEEMKKLFSRIKAEGRTLVVDVTRAKNGEKLEDIGELLPYMDVFVPNDEEIASLTGDADPAANARRLVQAGVGCAVVKTGAKGCLVATKEGIAEVPAVPGARCVDTTGAGDTFAAGLITGLCEGLPLPECARLGCAAASCSIEQIGATDGVKSREQVLERLRRG